MARRHRRCVRPPHHLTSRNRGWTTPTTSWCLQTGRVCAHGRVTFRTRRLAARPQEERPQQEPRRRLMMLLPPHRRVVAASRLHLLQDPQRPRSRRWPRLARRQTGGQRRSVRVYRSRLRRTASTIGKRWRRWWGRRPLHSARITFRTIAIGCPVRIDCLLKKGWRRRGLAGRGVVNRRV